LNERARQRLVLLDEVVEVQRQVTDRDRHSL
jgi:hypothetical protein